MKRLPFNEWLTILVFAALAVLLLFGAGCVRKAVEKPGPQPGPQAQPVAPAPTPTATPTRNRLVRSVVEYHAARPTLGADLGYVEYVAGEVVHYAAMLGLREPHMMDLLAILHEETRFKPTWKHMDGKSHGAMGVRYNRERELRSDWRKRGVILGSLDDPSAQVALGVMAYWKDLGRAKGDRFQTIRRYNGGNRGAKSKAYKQAHAYAMRVTAWRKRVFGE